MSGTETMQCSSTPSLRAADQREGRWDADDGLLTVRQSARRRGFELVSLCKCREVAVSTYGPTLPFSLQATREYFASTGWIELRSIFSVVVRIQKTLTSRLIVDLQTT